jgi:bifunctional non-homologous end joining protein LigD
LPVLVAVGGDGRVRVWSRHATSLTDRVGSLVEAFADAAAGSVFDGELVVLSNCHGRPTQDFAALTRAVFTGAPAAAARLTFVGFDVLRLPSEDQCRRPWRDRDAMLRDVLPVSDRVRLITTQPASVDAHEAVVALGFEGTVLKRPGSTYRPGRQSSWVKHKARCAVDGVVLSAHRERDGQCHAICNVDGRRARVLAGAGATERIGQSVSIL